MIISLAAICFFLPIWMRIFLGVTPKSKMSQDTWTEKWGTLVMGLETDFRTARYFYFYMIARRLLMALTLYVPFA